MPGRVSEGPTAYAGLGETGRSHHCNLYVGFSCSLYGNCFQLKKKGSQLPGFSRHPKALCPEPMVHMDAALPSLLGTHEGGSTGCPGTYLLAWRPGPRSGHQ